MSMSEDDLIDASYRAKALELSMLSLTGRVNSAIIANRTISDVSFRTVMSDADIMFDYIKYGIKPKE